ncbi:MAG: isocitrate lyase/PEP mutase family protein [Deltaproteobacteria bacterium]|nr:isocitrate lyase/PEP mutase family protein [Deltaproteobacteria bacterium]
MGETTRVLRRALESPGMVMAPFVFDGLQARLAEQAGFSAVYMTGFGTAAARGYPDVGLLTMTEMVANARSIAGAVDIPVICDADTGYGNALNVARTVGEYESAGAAALHIEDQVWPKRCGFLQGKEVIPMDDMLPKLRAALDARADPDFVVIARTDALQPHGWDEAEKRARAYSDAGADLVFVDGIRSVADLDEYQKRLGDLACVYNGQLEPSGAIGERGFKLMIHIATLGVAYLAMRDAMRELHETGSVRAAEDPRAFGEMVSLLGAAEALERAEKYA